MGNRSCWWCNRRVVDEAFARGKIAGAWSAGIHDNIFEVGGHSLLATQLISRLRDAFRIEIRLKMFFAGASTVARLAGAVEEIQFREASEGEVAAMLKELDELSDEEVKALLAGEANELVRVGQWVKQGRDATYLSPSADEAGQL